MRRLVKSGVSIGEWLIKDAAAFAGDNLPSRFAALRAVAPVIAEATSEFERQALVRVARDRFSQLEERMIEQAIKESAAVPAKFNIERREGPELDIDDLLRRSGLTLRLFDSSDPSSAKRRLSALILELLLVRPQLLDTAEAALACQLLDGVPALVVREARGQWAESQRIHGPTLLEVVPTEEQRQWMAARMVVGEVDAALHVNLSKSLTDAVQALRGVHLREYERLLSVQSARLGAQGDPAAEEALLNEVVATRRQRVRGGATGEN